MNSSAHFFDPELAQLYTRTLPKSSIAWADDTTALRHLFYQLNQSEYDQTIMPRAYDFIQYKLKQVQQRHATEINQDYTADNLCALQTGDIAALPLYYATRPNVTLWVKQTRAILLTQPHWLQTISTSISSQSTPALELIALFLHLRQQDSNGIDLTSSYQAMLLTMGIQMPNIHSYEFSQRNDLLSKVLEFATLQLALSIFPRVFLPEILGFTLAYCKMPTPIEVCFPQHQLPGVFFQQRQSRLNQAIIPLQDCIRNYLPLFPYQAQELGLRIQQGFWLYYHQLQICSEQFHALLKTPPPRSQAIIRLLQTKAAAATGHHHKILLQGITLNKWFAELPNNAQAFLQALAQSDYIDKQHPAKSRLLKLFAFKGPMFGVLNESEQDMLLKWIQEGANSSLIDMTKEPAKARLNRLATKHDQLPKSYTKLSNRALYYYLVNVDLFPDVLPIAKNKLSKLLQTCALLNTLPFKHYSHQQLDNFINNHYQREVSTYRPLQGKPKISKEAYIWGFEQIAPLILIDGCWIQNSLSLESVSPEISSILYGIYCDETGNGHLEQNHPFIFQQLLDSLSIRLPPTYSKAFINHSGFINSAFDLPVFMLSLSRFSIQFLPELLGLNMAIELSGLGKSYLRLVDDWNYWGINPSIASIHISIDNYASGHAFLAKKAIQLYMDEIMLKTGDHAQLDKQWRRIYTGYASLRFVGGRFKFALPVWYLIHKYQHKLPLLTSPLQ